MEYKWIKDNIHGYIILSVIQKCQGTIMRVWI